MRACARTPARPAPPRRRPCGKPCHGLPARLRRRQAPYPAARRGPCTTPAGRTSAGHRRPPARTGRGYPRRSGGALHGPAHRAACPRAGPRPPADRQPDAKGPPAWAYPARPRRRRACSGRRRRGRRPQAFRPQAAPAHGADGAWTSHRQPGARPGTAPRRPARRPRQARAGSGAAPPGRGPKERAQPYRARRPPPAVRRRFLPGRRGAPLAGRRPWGAGWTTARACPAPAPRS